MYKNIEDKKEYNKRFYRLNKEKIDKRISDWTIKNREKRRGYKLKYRYGLTIEDYSNMLNKQKEKCAICYKHKRLYVDHCHITKKVRGLLCFNCNNALGAVNDSVEILKEAIKYING